MPWVLSDAKVANSGARPYSPFQCTTITKNAAIPAAIISSPLDLFRPMTLSFVFSPRFSELSSIRRHSSQTRCELHCLARTIGPYAPHGTRREPAGRRSYFSGLKNMRRIRELKTCSRQLSQHLIHHTGNPAAARHAPD
jgi:hypothetical protein